MLSNFSTIRREIAAVLVGVLGLGAHFVPALAAVDPVWIDLAAGAGALAVLALVENRIDGISLTALARIAADHLIRDDNVIEAIRAARVLRGDPPESDLTRPPVEPRTGRAFTGAPSTRGGG
jgi:hypothetical protein